MQGEKITKRILLDAQAKKEEILQTSKEQAQEVIEKANTYAQNQKLEADKKIEEFKISVKDKYDTLLKIEGNKILLDAKQKILDDLKVKATNFLSSLKKADMQKLLEKLLKTYAKKGETVMFCLKGFEEEDVSSLKVVKELDLKVKKSKLDGDGIVISNASFDKNLLFSSLVSNVFEEQEGKIGKILF